MIPGLVQHRDLNRDELCELVRAYAAREHIWRPHVLHDPDRRIFTRLWHDDHVTAWLICWMDGQDTGLHDHGESSGAVAVLDGAVREERLRPGHVSLSRTLRAGQTFDFDPKVIHRVSHPGDGVPAVTLHAYSPPLREMGAYVPVGPGSFERRFVPEDVELRVGQPASTGSSAASLTSVSASSSAGSERLTTPTPA